MRNFAVRVSKGGPMMWARIGSAFLLLFLLALLIGHGSAAGQANAGYIDLVTRLEVDRFGIGQPSSLTSDPTTGTLLLFEGTNSHAHTISTFGDLLATEKIEGLADGVQQIEYDARSGSLLAFDPGQRQLVAVPWERGSSGGAVSGDNHTAVALPITEVNGIAVDPTTGDVYLLDGDSRRFIQIDGAGMGSSSLPLSPMEPVSSIALDGEAGVLRGLAFDPERRHLFSYSSTHQQLFEYTLTGELANVYDLASFNLIEPQELAFAPSTDETDAASATSLFVAGGGEYTDIWEFTFAPSVAPAMAATAATLVQTINVWQFSPPSPDASGATYLPHSDRLLETDSEVNEKTIYEDANQFEMTLGGSLVKTYDTTDFTNEPTGIAFDPDRNHLFITDDNAKMVYESDLSYNMVNSFSVSRLDGKGVDPEGIAYNTWNGRLYIAGGVSDTIFWIDPGADNDFGTSDDVEGSFPATNLSDPEGITFNTDNGNLYGVGKKDIVAEYTTSGSVVQMIDISAANAQKPAGLAYGPTSVGGGKSIYITDRGIDADSDINGGKGDGKIYEFALGSVGPPAAPTAGFTGSPTGGPQPLTVNFTNSSGGSYDTCSWDFGDSSSSSDCNDPSHIYNAIGTYSVTLTVSGPGGSDTKTEVDYIQVVEPAVAAFSGIPTEGAAPQTVTFSNGSSGAFDTCSWDFGDGGSSNSCSASVSHEYTVGGVFTVSLTVSGTGGSSTETKNNYITVHQAPTADFDGTPTSGPAPLSVSFSNQTTGDYENCAWIFGDGDSSSGPGCDDSPTHSYTSPGTYTVELAVDGSWGVDSITKTNYIQVGVPAVTAFSGSPTTGIAPQKVTFSNGSSGDYDTCAWDFGDGGSSSSCEASVSHTYATGGVFPVSLTVSGIGGENTKTRLEYITIYEPPTADFSALPAIGPAPLTVQFTNLSTGDYDTCSWSFGDGGGSNGCANPSHEYANPGTYEVSLTVSGLGGESTTVKANYIAAAVPVTADFSGSPTGGIAPLQVTFTNLATGDFDSCLWEFGDNSSSAGCANPEHSYAAAGVYTVSLTVSGAGGSQTASKAGYITVSEAGNANFSATPTQGIAPLTVNFTNLSLGDFDSCLWDFGDGHTLQSCENPAFSYTTPGNYSVSLAIDGPGGPGSVTFTDLITVYDAAVADFEADPREGMEPLVVNFTNLSSGDYLTCSWNFGDGSSSSVCDNPSHTYAAAGIYTVSLTVDGPGGMDTRTVASYINVDEATISFSATPRTGPVPLMVSFSNLSNGKYDTCLWSFGDGETSSDCDDPSHMYSSPGTYTVELATNGPSGSDSARKIDYISVESQLIRLPLVMRN
ncbi:MAG: PKD domain-containing protein [Chloroflexi bacterium]|jgi:PKD repeat protein/uncharacterized protein YjiK|nr:PKD domain-containing protein [Chloroflexota bacterium]